jgi:putative membrane protein
MSPELQAFASGFPILLLHGAIGVGLLVVGAGVYALISPNRELQGIRQGNGAAAVSLGGVTLGLAIPLAAALATATSLIGIGLWGAAVLAISLAAFALIDLVLAGLPQRMRDGDIPAAIVLVAAKLGVSLILAAGLVV